MKSGFAFASLIASAAVLAGSAVPAFAAEREPTTRIQCESKKFRDNYCRVPMREHVRIVERTSISSCYSGESWGYDEEGIWVNNGCGAVFETYGQRVYPREQRVVDAAELELPGTARLVCKSKDMRYTYCSVRVPADVTLIEQISDTPCRHGRTWGFDRGGVWVDGGCTAEFAVIDPARAADAGTGRFDDRGRFGE